MEKMATHVPNLGERYLGMIGGEVGKAFSEVVGDLAHGAEVENDGVAYLAAWHDSRVLGGMAR